MCWVLEALKVKEKSGDVIYLEHGLSHGGEKEVWWREATLEESIVLIPLAHERERS